MDTDLIPNIRGNVQNLRNMWSTKVKEEQKLLKPKATVYRSQSHTPNVLKEQVKIELESTKSVEQVPKYKTPIVTFNELKPIAIESNFSDAESDESDELPPPPPPIVFKQQAQTISTLKQSVTKMFDFEKKKANFCAMKNTGIHRWHITRLVFRSGLIFVRSRRASDSIIPILMRTHIAQSRARSYSIDSTHTETPFESFIDYISSNKNDNNENLHLSMTKPLIKRTISDATACIQRNKLEETIAQYETIMRHLKNYDQFIAEHPQTLHVPVAKKFIEMPKTSQKSISTKRQTQSLSRNVGRTFTEFIMNDLLSPQNHQESRRPSAATVVHAASQTDLRELIEKIDAIPIEDTRAVIKELDTAINSVMQEPPISPNAQINVIVVNSPPVEPPKEQKPPPPKEKTLIQRLFEGKKSSFTPEDIHMEPTRLTPELEETFEIAKEKCFFPSEQSIYATKMVKLDRRGYKQHIRILCITNERVYNITKKKPYPKEAVLFNDILGISCTERKDGFVCIHTRETRDDRGDWLFLVEHPCEFVTYLFMAMKKTNNNDKFLKVHNKFKHTRRNIATITDECIIEARPSEAFHMEYENYEVFAIYTP